jgi:PKHD-type hydroxylase
MIYEFEILNDEKLKYVMSYYKYLEWGDGKDSNANRSIKRCNTSYYGDAAVHLNKYCTNALSEKLTYPYSLKKISNCYFSEFNTKDYYNYHHDHNPCGGVNAHWSVTCFLSDPDTYEGGELVLQIGGKEIEYKLQSGFAVVYPTGILHKVNEITSGSRKVFCAWLQSSISSKFMRSHVLDYGIHLMSKDLTKEMGEFDRFRMELIREFSNDL